MSSGSQSNPLSKTVSPTSLLAQESRKTAHLSDELKKNRKRAANRASAMKSRYRKLVILEELQKRESEIQSTNDAMRRENDALRTAISQLNACLEMGVTSNDAATSSNDMIRGEYTSSS
uniref:BZIP domain-containing protein n=1 Tax=Odontella aurita TaxID=265563 RepID=A0A7S4JJ37_9STRA|mmetsp:Transcript_47268/g.143124  ORF Transcript_47268/g.143124 Transcript_47268/m.143124 type:complete len:119 (+) Transcript_47268:195-551(+)